MLPLLVLYSSMLPLPLLYSSGHATLLVVFMHSFLPPSQTTEPPAPVLPLAPSPSGPPSQLVPPDEPQPGPSGLHRPAILVSAHIEHIVGSFPSSFSLFISFDQLSFYYIYICRCWSLSLLFLLLGFGDMLVFFPLPRSLGGQEGCGPTSGTGGPQTKGPPFLDAHPTFAQTTQTGRSPTSGRTSEHVLGMHFSCHLCHLHSCLFCSLFTIRCTTGW